MSSHHSRSSWKSASFIDPHGGGSSALPIVPPFYFSGMTARVLPLRARMATLQNFCDRYLNIVPAEVARFKVFLPYVYLMMLDYGRMAPAAANLGWIAQHEVLFSIPLEWHRGEGRRSEFVDWAWVSPYIFVDSEISVQLGRTVYGWPKMPAELTAETLKWLRDPLAQIDTARVGTAVFDELYEGRPMQMKTLLEVHARQPPAMLRVPPETNNPLAPWMLLPNMIHSTAGLMRDFGNVTARAGAARFESQHPLAAMPWLAPDGRGSIGPAGVDLHFNTVNLKQFRSSDNPSRFCYQALTNARMGVEAFHGAGFMGESALLSGSNSGGFTVRLYRWPSLPIIENLGLEVDRQVDGHGAAVAELKPVFPFWYEVDMEYSVARNLAQRCVGGGWRDRCGERRSEGAAEVQPLGDFNGTLGPGSQAIGGPFTYGLVTSRLMVLLARRSKLEQFIARTLNEPLDGSGVRFELRDLDPPPGGDPDETLARVFLVVSNWTRKSSLSNNVGLWDERELTFLIPVKPVDPLDGAPEQLFLPAFSLVNTTTAAITNTEVIGIPTTKASLDRPGSKWLLHRGPSEEVQESLLRASFDTFPVFGEGQEPRNRRVVEIREVAPPPAGAPVSKEDVGGGVLVLRAMEECEEVAASDVEAFEESVAQAMSTTPNGFLLGLVALKQVRDAEEPDHAAYQALTCLTRLLDCSGRDLSKTWGDGGTLEVRIRDFPAYAVVAQLGLQTKTELAADGGVIYVVNPEISNWVCSPMVESLGRTLVHRCGGGQWSKFPEEERLADDAVGALAERMNQPGGSPWTPAVGIIPALVRREFGNKGPGTRYHAGVRRIEDALGAAALLPGAHGVAGAEIVVFERAVAAEAERPPRHRPFPMAKLTAAMRRFKRTAAAKSAMDDRAADRPVTPPEWREERIDGLLMLHDDLSARTPPDYATATLLGLLNEHLGLEVYAGDAAALTVEERASITAAIHTLDDRRAAMVAAALAPGYLRARRGLVQLFGRANQLPDFVVHRDVAGTARDQLFPADECIDGVWYAGPAHPPSGPGGGDAGPGGGGSNP